MLKKLIATTLVCSAIALAPAIAQATNVQKHGAHMMHHHMMHRHMMHRHMMMRHHMMHHHMMHHHMMHHMMKKK